MITGFFKMRSTIQGIGIVALVSGGLTQSSCAKSPAFYRTYTFVTVAGEVDQTSLDQERVRWGDTVDAEFNSQDLWLDVEIDGVALNVALSMVDE